MTVGKRIKFIREQLGLTQEDVAKKVGVAIQTIYKYENEIVTNIPLPKLEKIADALHTTPAYLMGWSDEPQKENKPEKPELAENMIVYHRDGKTSEVKLSPKKMDLLIQMIEEFKENDNPDL